VDSRSEGLNRKDLTRDGISLAALALRPSLIKKLRGVSDSVRILPISGLCHQDGLKDIGTADKYYRRFGTPHSIGQSYYCREYPPRFTFDCIPKAGLVRGMRGR
jgi:hypothetical protein